MKSFRTIISAGFLASALVLAGCGGGSNNAGMDDDMQAEKTPQEMCAEAGNTWYENACRTTEELIALGVDQGKQEAADEADAKAKVALAKALKAAITATVTDAVVTNSSLDVDGTGAIAAISLKKTDGTVAVLGNWKGADYSGEQGSGASKSYGDRRVYHNQGMAKSVSFTDVTAPHGLAPTAAADDDPRTYTVDTSVTTTPGRIAGSKFPTTGTTTYPSDDRKFGGTFMEANGTYQCTGAADCTATNDGSGNITLAGTWTFTPLAGATVQIPDADYLRFGWWVRKDSDGPTHARAFAESSATTLPALTAVPTGVVGKATYNGKAAGKFAISGTVDDVDNSGHFTADAELNANFLASGSTLSGTIDEFRLNDGSDDPNWTVKLREATESSGAFTLTTAGTTWAIGQATSANTGMWTASMYEDQDDGNNTPDSIIGTFNSGIGGTHSMTGAFGTMLDKSGN